jgi:uncharacterized protein YvpB
VTGRRLARRAAHARDGRASAQPRHIYTSSANRRRRRRRTRARRWPLLLVCGIALGTLLLLAIHGDGSNRDPASAAETVRVVQGGREVIERPVAKLRRMDEEGLRSWLDPVRDRRRQRRGVATITLQSDRGRLLRAVRRAIAAGGGTVPVRERPVASRARLPIVKQALRNNCETAALSMLLAARGIRVPQLELQRQLARDGPRDPGTAGDGTMVWGDPSRGFVGRPEGGGVAGGYGVYERPIRLLARRRGAELRDLSRRRPATIYRTLLEGRPVLAWVGLSDGPFKTWRTPDGGRVTGNFGEHTVVLTGVRGESVSVNDPLAGERTAWSKADFEVMWARLGRRALAG